MTHNEIIKEATPTLAGAIAQTLADPEADRFSEDDVQFLKFHGIYQQDDRDLRKTQKKFIMMIRGRIPGGVMTPRQWCVFDDLATQHGNNTLRVTTRQSIQFHGVVKSGLGPLVKKINEALLSTLAACGDVNRNVMAPPTPAYTQARAQVVEDCRRVADALKPRTRAYHSIWLEGTQLNLDDPANKDFEDPLYGKTYLPRKFKTAFVVPPVNDIDILTNDVGFIAILENDQLVGYNLAVGGGMGRSHGNQATYPRLADVIGFLEPQDLVAVAKAVVTIHRDFGDRVDRKHARLKYVVQERGVDWTRAEVEQRAGIKLEPARPFKFTTTGDLYGWHRQTDGRWFLTLFVETGRVKDAGNYRLKTALRSLIHATGALGMTLLTAGRARYRAPFQVDYTTLPMPLANLDPAFEGFRLVHLSDIHVSKQIPPSYLDQIVSHINSMGADLVCLTGDLVSHNERYALPVDSG